MMRLFLFALAATFLIGQAACWEDIYCSSCDYSCEQSCEDACSWFEYPGDYSCTEDLSGVGVDYVDCSCYTSGWVWFVLALMCLCVLLCVCCTPPLVIVAYYWVTDSKKPIEPAPEGAYRLYSALNPCLYRFAVDWLNLISCMLCRPFLVLESARMALRRVDVRGTTLFLDAEWGDYCKLVWLPTCIFNCFTCGFYACCGFAEKREDEFLDDRTTVQGEPLQPVVFFRAKADWWYRWIAALITAWTCGLAYSCFYVDLVAKSVGRMNLAGVGATSILTTSQFFSDVWLPMCIIDCFSCYLYSLCGFAHKREAAYTDEHVAPAVASATADTLMGKDQVYYGATHSCADPPGPLLTPVDTPTYAAAPTTPGMDDYSYV